VNPEEVRDFAERYRAAWCSGHPAEVARHYAPEGSLTRDDGTPSVGCEDITAAAKAFMDGNHVRVSGYELWDLGDGVIRTSRGYYNQQDYDRQVSGGASAG
jgi:hypothetical protein